MAYEWIKITHKEYLKYKNSVKAPMVTRRLKDHFYDKLREENTGCGMLEYIRKSEEMESMEHGIDDYNYFKQGKLMFNILCGYEMLEEIHKAMEEYGNGINKKYGRK